MERLKEEAVGRALRDPPSSGAALSHAGQKGLGGHGARGTPGLPAWADVRSGELKRRPGEGTVCWTVVDDRRALRPP